MFELTDETASKVMVLAKQIAAVLQEGLHADGVNLVQNNGEAAGQTIFHFHMHIIPRYQNDTVNVTWRPGELTENDQKDILSLFEK